MEVGLGSGHNALDGEPLGIEVGLSPVHMVLDGDPTPL